MAIDGYLRQRILPDGRLVALERLLLGGARRRVGTGVEPDQHWHPSPWHDKQISSRAHYRDPANQFDICDVHGKICF